MRYPLTPAGTAVVVSFSAFCFILSAQSSDRLAATKARLDSATQVLRKMPEQQRRHLSSGALNLLQVATGLTDSDIGGLGLPAHSHVPAALGPIQGASVPVMVNDPTNDFAFSVLSGFTQSETSTAWCGTKVVVGFNDSGSFVETLFSLLLFGQGGLSFTGASMSGDSGQTFQDIGPINPGPNTADFLGGDPTVSCGNIHNFNFVQLLESSEILSPNTFQPLTGLAFSKSTDSGATWGNPIPIILKDGTTHFVDKPWHAIDPLNPQHVFVTYTDFDSSGKCGTNSNGSIIQRTAIEMVRSVDGGNNWSAPVVVDEACSTAPSFTSLQGSQVAVDAQRRVYVAWEVFNAQPQRSASRELRIRRSDDGGVNFDFIHHVSDVAPVGDGFALQGTIRDFEFPSLAINRASGALYIVWNDGRLLRDFDLESPTFSYGYANVFFTKSLDHGTTWSSPVRVNDDAPPSPPNRGVDHFQPAVGADSTGKIGVCWYDRRVDPRNWFIARWCATSTTGGTTWVNQVASAGAWQPIKSADAFVNPYYLGDYDQVATDTLQTNTGFLESFGLVEMIGTELVPNQDVFATKF